MLSIWIIALRVSLVTLKDTRSEVCERLASLSAAHMDSGEYEGRVEELNWVLSGIDRRIVKYERWLNDEQCSREESR